MWRFILISFTFLGWSFYVLSGGADYMPRPGSIQALAKLGDIRPVQRPVRYNVIELARDVLPPVDDDANVTRAVATLAELNLTKDGVVNVTLTSTGAEGDGISDTGTDLEKVAALTDAPEGAADIAEIAEPDAVSPRDIREVTGKVVNMRDGPGTSFERVGKLTIGTKIEVLETPGNGWIKLRVVGSDETGWMADWLVTAAAN